MGVTIFAREELREELARPSALAMAIRLRRGSGLTPRRDLWAGWAGEILYEREIIN